MSSSSSAAGARPWRTAFLSLRDETLSPPPSTAVLALLRDLVLCHPADSLAASAAGLPLHEVVSDLMLLLELASMTPESVDSFIACIPLCRLINILLCTFHMDINLDLFALLLKFTEKFLKLYIVEAVNIRSYFGKADLLIFLSEVLEIFRLISLSRGVKSSFQDTERFLHLLNSLVSCQLTELRAAYCLKDSRALVSDISNKSSTSCDLWEMQTTALSLMEDSLSGVGPSLSANSWHTLLEGLRSTMDFLVSKSLIVEDKPMSRFYATLLRCLHLILLNPKGSLTGHVAGLVPTLQMFFTYGLSSISLLVPSINPSKKVETSPVKLVSGKMESSRSDGPYRPPHLRRRQGNNSLSRASISSNIESSKLNLTSSDSEHSDTDGLKKIRDPYQSSRARIAAINCIQDICQSDSKSLAALWTMLLPENNVLQPRKYPATLMTCLLFDPILKARLASASTLAAMLNEKMFFLQVAEYRESIKCGSFTTLSSSLGQILMQLHKGILHLIQIETNGSLLASLFKVFIILISATPYDRMPSELLPTVIMSLHSRIIVHSALNNEDDVQLGTVIRCLEAALSRSPPSSTVQKALEEDISRDDGRKYSCLPSVLIQFSKQGCFPVVRFEALQALKALSHNYPNISRIFWDEISSFVHELLVSVGALSNDEIVSSSVNSDDGQPSGPMADKCTMAAIKLLDECLRAASGFLGTDNLNDFRLMEIQLLSDVNPQARISSAPLYTANNSTVDCLSGSEMWNIVIEKHLMLALCNSSPMVRAASVTCFAGMTSSVFFSLSSAKQDFVISSSVNLALNDNIPSVRSAACRAIGVIATFSGIFSRVNALKEFVHVIEFKTHDPVASVRLTSSWALANICDSLRFQALQTPEKAIGGSIDADYLPLVIGSALRLTKDGDKIRSNAVRALGNLSRFVQFTHHDYLIDVSVHHSDSSYPTSEKLVCDDMHSARSALHFPGSELGTRVSGDCSDWLGRIVQAFVSCATTGNVKVQWNVCHAFGNLFMNGTVMLQNTPWLAAVYSILLLLVRDSNNFKIRTQAALALSVPTSRLDYGSSFDDVVQGLVHVLETLRPDSTSSSSFTYKDTLQKQVMFTTMHVLRFSSSSDRKSLKDFLVKKETFLEEWLNWMFSSFKVAEEDHYHLSTSGDGGDLATELECPDANGTTGSSCMPKKMDILRAAAEALIDVYGSSGQQHISLRFQNLLNSFVMPPPLPMQT